MKTNFKALLAGASAVAFGVIAFQSVASAADLNDRMFVEKSPWQVRVRALGVVPEDDGAWVTKPTSPDGSTTNRSIAPDIPLTLTGMAYVD